ncbi:MAG: DegT/DnrJ/EryC1/StrS family aminotransferase [Candidatus Handelsmanbacteria bacterium]|nr:DegT/DnrJ/EryC1/StrS family aminotransferase [Candidatus Handelsmanbacteria bacterium]
MKVPINDLHLQHASIQAELEAALAQVTADCSFILGPQVLAFERAFAAYCGVGHCVGVSNGTDALKLALRAAGVGRGDEVITTPHTFAATIEAICELGARPVLADIEDRHFTIDPAQVAELITPRTRALLPVHIYGHPADMDPLLGLAQRHGLALIEDAAQAQGARYKGRPAGSLGLAGCFSFYPGKNLGAYGDAGGITTHSGELAARLRLLRNHGQDPGKKFFYQEPGYNHRMDGFQGAVLGVKLPHLEGWNQRRRQLAEHYRQGLQGLAELILPTEAEYAHHVYHLYVVRARDREGLAAALRQGGIDTAVQYPHPLHLTTAYQSLGYRKGALPRCEQACAQILSLPIFPELEEAQVDYVTQQIRRYYGG